ncbi:MAG: T9SS type A sorting domain-containing protein [Candidatus Marinimicrobia bacterium]|nr:T9SS type A sorting domain-containing protein [Candidatus Neomarinimicrobiota bacterium]
MTNISYALPISSEVSLIIYNILGKEVARLVDGFQSAGEYQSEWNASNVSSGIYFYRLRSGNVVQTRKMVLLK